jgi:lipopolysaccharide transport system ATP-binding protein
MKLELKGITKRFGTLVANDSINLVVESGEIHCLLGENGAGKSTLLKLLSRITSPTTGSIKIAGRMASLLEVGTGFHPELTGRENIFLNGAILGMTKKEIQSKFDEIVDFSGCELYIDTPTKRYSSGMTVRLGFAVAAFLDPEILVVDEVLAVGDAEFQKKAIGKMKEISIYGGRTVLFVSHNMEAVKGLCSSVVIIDNGCVIDNRLISTVEQTVNSYLDISNPFKGKFSITYEKLPIRDTRILKIALKESKNNFLFDETIEVELFIDFIREVTLTFEVTNSMGGMIFIKEAIIKDSGRFLLKIDKETLVIGEFQVFAQLTIPFKEVIQVTDKLTFNITSWPKEFVHYSRGETQAYPLGYTYLKNEVKKYE